MKDYTIPKPTPQQLLWQEQELGVIIHYIMDIYAPHMRPSQIKSKKVRKKLHPSKINPTNLDVDQWVRAAYELGAKYAVLVANFKWLNRNCRNHRSDRRLSITRHCGLLK